MTAAETAPAEKITIIGTHGTDDPEMLSLPFIMGNAALAMDVNVVVILQGSAVLGATKSCLKHVLAQGHPSLRKLVVDFMEFGGMLLLCAPCLDVRNIAKEELVEGAVPVKAARVVSEVLESRAVLTY
jgi:predicted peroxiredoxin